jgi:hypothetical protein
MSQLGRRPPAKASSGARSGAAAALSARPVKLLEVPGARGRRFTKWHVLGIAVLAFGLSYGVCRVADWLITTDEERIVAQLEALGAKARDGRLDELLDDVRLADFGFSVGGWGEVYSFGAGEEEKLLAKGREWSQWEAVRTLRIKADEDDVTVEGDRARANADLLFEEDGRPWRQPVRILFRKQGDRWYVATIELVRPDEILRP